MSGLLFFTVSPGKFFNAAQRSRSTIPELARPGLPPVFDRIKPENLIR
jgi:hypothetical protein